MRRTLFGSLVVIMCCLSLGMGSMGDQAPVNAPAPDKNFAVTVVDQDDVSLELEKFSCNGMTFITGKMGKAELSIDFDKIRSILFVEQGGRLKALLTLTDNKQVELDIKKDLPCYGASAYAQVRILTGDIKQVHMHGQKQASE